MNILFIFLGLLPSFIWLSFFLKEDIHPEPRRMVFYVFLFGIIAAVVSFAIQAVLNNYLESQGIFFTATLPTIAFAAIEEVLKFFFVFLAVRKSKFFDEPMDAMIYMVTGAAGMAATENVALMLNDNIDGGRINVLILRFLGATLLHIFSSALVGFYWAKGLVKNKVFMFIPVGLILAVVLHSAFNYLIITLNGTIIYSILLLISAAFLVFYDFEKMKKDHHIIT